MNLGETIRTKRLQLKMTQEQMARRLGVTARAVHKWEHGTSYPDVSLLPALARLLETDLNELLSFDADISDQELAAITTEAMEIMKSGQYAEAFSCLEKKVRQYPLFALADLGEIKMESFVMSAIQKIAGKRKRSG